MKTPVIRKDLIYPELSFQIVGYAYEVFNELGPGHSEKTYQKAFAIMLRKNNHEFKEQVYYPLKFKDEIISRAYLDFRVEEKIIIELKKDEQFTKTHIEQVLNYLKLSGLKLALLINFTKQGIKYKRIVNINQTNNNQIE